MIKRAYISVKMYDNFLQRCGARIERKIRKKIGDGQYVDEYFAHPHVPYTELMLYGERIGAYDSMSRPLQDVHDMFKYVGRIFGKSMYIQHTALNQRVLDVVQSCWELYKLQHQDPPKKRAFQKSLDSLKSLATDHNKKVRYIVTKYILNEPKYNTPVIYTEQAYIKILGAMQTDTLQNVITYLDACATAEQRIRGLRKLDLLIIYCKPILFEMDAEIVALWGASQQREDIQKLLKEGEKVYNTLGQEMIVYEHKFCHDKLGAVEN